MAAVDLFGVPKRNLAAMLFLAYFVFSFQACGSLLIDPTLIGQELQTFAKEALGVDEMQVLTYSKTRRYISFLRLVSRY